MRKRLRGRGGRGMWVLLWRREGEGGFCFGWCFVGVCVSFGFVTSCLAWHGVLSRFCSFLSPLGLFFLLVRFGCVCFWALSVFISSAFFFPVSIFMLFFYQVGSGPPAPGFLWVGMGEGQVSEWAGEQVGG